MITKKEFFCPVCGFEYDEPILNEGEIEDYIICPSCSFEYGVTDIDRGFSYEEWRSKWVSDGMNWGNGAHHDSPPENWNPKEQLKNIGVIVD